MDLKGFYVPREERYDSADRMYNRCGRSGVLLPKVSLGFWHNFGGVDPYERSRAITHYAFDHGITHFDLANNYGPPYDSAEETMCVWMPYTDYSLTAICRIGNFKEKKKKEVDTSRMGY